MKILIIKLILICVVSICCYASKSTYKSYNSKDAYIVASVIWNEARGESFCSKQAVASVIYNRSNGNSAMFSLIVRRKNWLGEPYKEINVNDDISEEIKIAKAMFEGKFKPVANYTHFYNPKLANPDWKTKLRNKKKIDNQIFGTI